MSEKLSADELDELLYAICVHLTDADKPLAVAHLDTVAAHIATLQREADGMREALQYITRWLMTDVDALPPHVTRDDVRIYHLDGAILHNCLERARAALNGSQRQLPRDPLSDNPAYGDENAPGDAVKRGFD